MTNPINKYSEEVFKNKVKEKISSILDITEYKGVDYKLKVHCIHGIIERRGWSVLNGKHCCRKGYYESGNMWKSNTNTIEDAKQRTLKNRPNTDVSNVYFKWDGKYKRLYGIKCTIHNIEYSSLLGSKVGQCPECFKEDNREKLRTAAPKAWASQSTGSFVSKKETKWLDELNIKDRQVWLEDVKYKVDGYDSETNTVYLYHGKFWHGCPKTFDPEMIHPIIKIPMKDLYEKTMYYENKLKQAGYNLVVKWGT
jgi:hypothetical protein